MAMAESLPPDASTASKGLRLNYIGEHCYGISGEVDTPGQGTAVSLLDFISGSGYIVATVQFGIHSESNNNISFSVKFNGDVVIGYALSGATSDAQSSNYWPIIIPPFTHVECIGLNYESGSAIPLTCFMTGRVYEP